MTSANSNRFILLNYLMDDFADSQIFAHKHASPIRRSGLIHNYMNAFTTKLLITRSRRACVWEITDERNTALIHFRLALRRSVLPQIFDCIFSNGALDLYDDKGNWSETTFSSLRPALDRKSELITAGRFAGDRSG